MRAGQFSVGGGNLTPAAEYYGNALTGVETFARPFGTVTKALTSQKLYLTFFTPAQSYTATQMVTTTGGTAAAATPTLCRMGVYTVAVNGNGTLVAAILNDTTLFAGGNTEYVRNFDVGGGLPTSYPYVAGQRYAHALLIVSAAAMPSVLVSGNSGSSATYARAPRLVGVISGQADLPVSFTAGGLSNEQGLVWIGAV